jgi:hypothetical protein
MNSEIQHQKNIWQIGEVYLIKLQDMIDNLQYSLLFFYFKNNPKVCENRTWFQFFGMDAVTLKNFEGN